MGTIGLPSSIPNKYAGPPVNLVPLRSITHRPTTIDKKFPVGQFVILGETPSTGAAGELWYLSNFDAGVPQWEQIATTNIVTTSYTANIGTATPTLGIIQIVGSSPISTSASGNSITINCAIASNAETIAGSTSNKVVVPSGLNAKMGTQTSGGVAYGQGSSSAVGWTSAGTANAVFIGGASPSFSTTATSYFSGISFDTGSNVLQRYVNVTTFTPVVYGSTSAGTATYQEQSGRYSVIGNMVFYNINLQWTGHTGTGNMMLSGFPYIFAAAQSFYPAVCMVQNIVLPANTKWVVVDGNNGTTTADITACIDNASFSQVQMDASGSLHISGWYPTNP